MEIKKGLETIINAIAANENEEFMKKHGDAIAELIKLSDDDFDYFLHKADTSINDLTRLFAVASNISCSGEDEYLLEFIVNGLYEHFHDTRIEKLEGMPCSSDKSSFIVGKTIQSIIRQENLTLYADYTKVDQIKENKEERAYWSPKTVKDTDEAKKLFWDWYYQK